MSALHPGYGGFEGTGPSPSIWSHFDGIEENKKFSFFDDFTGFRLTEAVAANVGTYTSESGGFISYEDTGASIAPLATEVGGVIRIATPAGDNTEAWLMPGSATSVFGKIVNNGAPLGFEARVRPVQNALRNILVGMAEEGCAVADTITDADALVSKDFVGFFAPATDADGLDTFYRKAGQNAVTVQEDAGTLTANGWVKVGFLFLPQTGNRDRMVKFFINGDEMGSYVTYSALTGAAFPADEEMHFLVGCKNGQAAITQLDVDWVKICQLR